MKLQTEVGFIDEKTRKAYLLLEGGREDQQRLYFFIKRAIDDLKQNAFCGIQLPKRLIPKEYRKYDLENLWKYNLPNAWRLLYTITSDNSVIILSVVIEWLPHKEYEKLMGFAVS